ncbi:MAG: biotin--[acetyl-CoA-carboxylase] ligase [Firmicutes bacterium]|nr:biotin--[acetyl-CoA-carboxylase] ligase [Bacillota bacterium]
MGLGDVDMDMDMGLGMGLDRMAMARIDMGQKVVDHKVVGRGGIGRRIIRLDEVDSTNIFARKLAEEGEPEGTCVVAERQTAGRGRMKRVWFSPGGGLWFSMILRPGVVAGSAGQVGLIGALAVARVLRRIAEIDARVKWPNDVVVEGRKLCGVLAEARIAGDRIEYIVLGMGLNIRIRRDEFPEELQGRATSILAEIEPRLASEPDSQAELEQQPELDPDNVLDHILREFEALYDRYLASGFADILRELELLCCTLGSYVTVASGNRQVRGVARALSADGSLVIETSEGSITISAGEIIGQVAGGTQGTR